MKKICRTCEHWQVTGSGEYGKAMYPGSWGTERRDSENLKCRCEKSKFKAISDDKGIFTESNFGCSIWFQASDIIDECIYCGALLYEYDRPATPWSREFEHKGITRFWHGNVDCEHEGINYHGSDPWSGDVRPRWIKKYLYVRSIVNPIFRDFSKVKRQFLLRRTF